MGAIEDIYAEVDADIPEEEFRAAVEEKVDEMGGLVDEEVAAMLIAEDLGESEVEGIADIEPGMEEVQFLGKVVSVGDVRTFERDEEDAEGRVVNVEVADGTGRVRLALWDEDAAAATEELEPGQVLRIKGRPKDGYSGLEVSADRVEVDEEAELDVDLEGGATIDSLAMGQSDVTLAGVVLDTESVRTFDRDDGSEGRVGNLVIGDETGRVRVTLWDEQTEAVETFEAGDTVEIVDGYVRERDGSLELHVNDRSAVEAVDADVEFVPEATDIGAVEIGETVDIAGVVRSADPKRTFDRDDGSEGQVRNVRLQDSTGDIRVALWGDKADLDIGPGDELLAAEVGIEDGWQDDLEASAGWQSTVTPLDGGLAATGDEGGGSTDGADDGGSTGLDAFADEDDAGATAPETTDDGPVEFTGTVVQTGDPVKIDDGEETVKLRGDPDVTLGQSVTVRGTRDGEFIDVEETF
ncbi:replication factor A [Haloglomus irregulare]|uniref:Replication factor A n=1 Tax=Haloglomus irregulare TaxID=2234134 RepID=A0A554MY34_9EURY|nr:single-stranded DNA binding protein [Haloglomus irregulare]TSD10058.1 replication factor A [Haloglomus irregulare]